jgi:manganese oxidase
MRGQKSVLPTLLSCLALVLVTLLSADLSAAQTLNGSSDKLKSGSGTSQPDVAANRPAVATVSSATEAKTVSDPVAADAALMNARAEVPKEQPAISSAPQPAVQCKRTINADVVAMAQPIMLNRLGAAIPGGMIFVLKRDTIAGVGNQLQLRPGKRPRPIVLRANVGDCLRINLTNAIPKQKFVTPGPNSPPPAAPSPTPTTASAEVANTSEVSLHVQGMEWVTGTQDDGSFVGQNKSSLASTAPVPADMPPNTQTYTLYAKAEGTFLMYTMGDTSSNGNQLINGLFGALNVQPSGMYADGKLWESEWYRSQVTADDLLLATYNANRLPSGSTLVCSPPGSSACTFTIKGKSVKVIKTPDFGSGPGMTKGGYLHTTGSGDPKLDNHPLIDYNAVYPATRLDGTAIPPELVGIPILNMLDANNNIVHTDLTAMITGPKAGRFPGANGDPNTPDPPCNAENNPALNPQPGVKVDPLFCTNPASPDRKQPYREITILYHGALTPVATQAFPIFTDPTMANMLTAGQDAFAINYGTGGIGAEIYANRIGVGPMGDCVDCKFEEFFLSAWSVGDPAMLVDRPANVDLGDLPATSPVQPPLPWIQNQTGTAAFTNGSATVNGTGTSFSTQLSAGDILMLRNSPGTIRGTVQSTPAPATKDTVITLAAPANATGSGLFRASVQPTIQPPLPAIVAPYRCSGPQLGDLSGTAPDQNCAGQKTPATGFPYSLGPLVKATRVYYPDDPSNVYNSYINDHVKFRILHGGRDVTHVHHQHAHQWLQSPNSDEGSYLDSQMISPGASYTLEMVYNGSGNRNKVVGDSIFHCHFYPHFAAGMWAMWRTHDTFESGTFLYPDGTTVNGVDVSGQVVPGSRALPDGEIVTGAPEPALVPLPTLPMAPLPAYAQIQKQAMVNGVPTGSGGQVVIGGTCQANKINGLDVIGGCTDGQVLNGTVINSQYDFARIKMVGQFQPSAGNKLENPGYPYFIPGIAGARAPHPPLDFACTQKDASGKCLPGTFLDGGLPRHVVFGGSVSYEKHNTRDWSKDLATMKAVQLAEDGEPVEKAAMSFFGQRCYATFFPDGTPGACPSSNSTPPQSTLNIPPTGFVLNGLPRGPQQGAPFADPAIDDNGNAVQINAAGKQTVRTYKAAAIQTDVTFNKKLWHFPQQRMLTLWKDVAPTLNYRFGNPASGRQPEPLFFRGNSGDIIEYWHTNLVPNYYLVDDFQVRTPTDILGQHIHLVKFDVTSSDGAANGFNYEDGTFSPEEVQEMIRAINHAGGLVVNGVPTPLLGPDDPQYKTKHAPPKDIFDCATNPNAMRCVPCPDNWTPTSRPQCLSWLGAQTTIQRWYLDPLVDDSNVDRTMRTVFTHDHFGPSTHQQAGLYAGLLIEPKGSMWTGNDGTPFGTQTDGGPTSWQAIIKTANVSDSYREFMLEFQDLQLAYWQYTNPLRQPSANPEQGWIDPANAINAPSGSPTSAAPSLITTGQPAPPTGTQSVNYTNEPIATRVGRFSLWPNQKFSDLSYAYDNSIQSTVNPPANPWDKPDPITPLMRAYQNDKVQVRVLVGAHVFAHQFNFEGPTWFSEPAWKNSGYRSVQAMGLSEHFEFLFKVPSSSAPSTNRKCPDKMSQANCVDYLYSPSMDENGIANGLWGLLRSYDPTKLATGLKALPNNPVGPPAKVTYATCPANQQPRVFNVTAVPAQRTIPSPGIIFNDRDPAKKLYNNLGIMYVRTEDLANGVLKDGVPIEPLILRANAGDCIEVNLTNGIFIDTTNYPANTAAVLTSDFNMPPPLNGPVYPQKVSRFVGLHPQLLSYDPAKDSGVNVGWNTQSQAVPTDQAVPFGKSIKYQWYAGKIDRAANGTLTHTPVEFGSLNLFPSDPMFQHINGLFGQMIIEPAGAKWECDAKDSSGNLIKVSCEPFAIDPTKVKDYTRAAATVTLADNSTFREAAIMISDTMRVVGIGGNYQGGTSTGAVNYRVEPWNYRYASNLTGDFSCMLSNQLEQVNSPPPAIGEPKTPIFTAEVGNAVRFRMTHPFGTGTSQVFTLHGHVWQRNPYANDSKVIGFNGLSQWIGSRDNHGSTDHFDLVIEKAGGEGGQAGDYLYSVFQPLQARTGTWGLFRVGHATPSTTPNAVCKPVAAPGYYPTPSKDDLDRFLRTPIQNPSKKP